MQSNLSKEETENRNQLISEILDAANGEEVHTTDLAWFLQLDTDHTDRWMRQHGFGKWINGKNGHWWRGIGKQKTT